MGQSQFLPTPSARRATIFDLTAIGICSNFYPRPPRGGRPAQVTYGATITVISTHALREEGDALFPRWCINGKRISTHALREEGDWSRFGALCVSDGFLPTPSARRATSGWGCGLLT